MLASRQAIRDDLFAGRQPRWLNRRLMRELADFSTERLLELREEYRAGRVKLVEREPDAEVRARLNAINSKMLAAIEAELEKRMGAQ
jgi:hypothetical protein